MNIAVVYVYPMVKIRTYYPVASRFARTYADNPAGIGHDLHVICNGAAPSDYERQAFSGLPAQFHTRSNFGWDIGAFQWAADNIPCDLLVCLGANIYFYRPRWLERMADAFALNGPTLYGVWGVPYRVHWHIRTTAFWLPPDLLRAFPYMVGSHRRERYDFEHGGGCITNFCIRSGMEPLMVTWQGVYPKDQWGEADGGPGGCLVFDQFTDVTHPPF